MRDGQIVELIRTQMFSLQDWCSGQLARQKNAMASTHTLAAHTQLRVQALIDCLSERPRYELWGVRLPVKLPLTAMEVEARYHVLLDKFLAELKARDEAVAATAAAAASPQAPAASSDNKAGVTVGA